MKDATNLQSSIFWFVFFISNNAFVCWDVVLLLFFFFSPMLTASWINKSVIHKRLSGGGGTQWCNINILVVGLLI